VTRWDREEQFIIFSVGDGLADGAAAIQWQRRFVHLETDAAGPRQTGQIGSKSVTQIHHGVDRKILREPARFVDPRDKLQMAPSERSPEPAGDKEIVTGLAPGAADPALPF